MVPTFALDGNDGLLFYTRTESIEILEKLIEYQCGDSADVFWKELFATLDKTVPKLNTMCIIGPPGSGKTFLADCVSAFMLNTGNIANFNKSCNFPLQDCKNRRFLVWNEPNFSPNNLDTLKMLLGGDPCPARIKYESDYVIPRTPVMMTTNKKVLPDNDAFSQRVSTWNWNSATYLKELKKKPHPLCMIDLYRKYTVVEINKD